MGYGLSTANANLAAAAAVGTNAGYAELATGAPGSAGTANASTVTTRQALAWGSASGGVESITNTPSWTAWGGTNGEVVTGLTTWSASTSGSFGLSAGLGSNVTMDIGDSLSLTSFTLTVPTAS